MFHADGQTSDETNDTFHNFASLPKDELTKTVVEILLHDRVRNADQHSVLSARDVTRI